jgi:hypothetical protein
MVFASDFGKLVPSWFYIAVVLLVVAGIAGFLIFIFSVTRKSEPEDKNLTDSN